MSGDTLTQSGPWCRACGEPALVEGDADLGKAVHAATGQELGADGHLCAPVGFRTAAMRAALGFP